MAGYINDWGLIRGSSGAHPGLIRLFEETGRMMHDSAAV